MLYVLASFLGVLLGVGTVLLGQWMMVYALGLKWPSPDAMRALMQDTLAAEFEHIDTVVMDPEEE